MPDPLATLPISGPYAGHGASTPRPPDQDTALRRAAEGLEAAFLAEMLKIAGIGRTPETGGGGAGEDHFGSFLADAHAAALSRRGGVGLAESIFESLKARS